MEINDKPIHTNINIVMQIITKLLGFLIKKIGINSNFT